MFAAGVTWMPEAKPVAKADQDVSANIKPPPGLDCGIELTDATPAESPAVVKIDGTAAASPSERDEPMKVKFAGADASTETDSKTAALAAENESLAFAHAQLALENAMLRQNSVGMDDMQNQGWWPQQQWQMPQMPAPWSAPPATEPGDIVYFHGLQNATELNNQYGTVEKWDESSLRWVVRIATGEAKFVKPQNLMVVREQQPAAQWYPNMYGYPQSQQKSKPGRGKKNDPATWSFGSDSTAASANSGKVGDGSDMSIGRTTVMMRNIPNDYSGQMVLELLNDQGFKGSYNLFYLPMDYQRKAGFGYAFVDLTTSEEATRFHQHFEGFSDWKVASVKVCCVGWSTLQGLPAHIEHYRNSPVMHHVVPEEFKPMLFENGKPVQFPPPTKSIRAPRMKTTGGSRPQNVQKELLA